MPRLGQVPRSDDNPPIVRVMHDVPERMAEEGDPSTSALDVLDYREIDRDG